MNRKLFVVFVLASLTMTAGPTLGGPASGWFDLANCHLCQPLAAEPELLANLTWEHQLIEKGMISVTTFKNAEAREAFYRAMAKMDQLAKEMQMGKMAPLCGFCTSLGMILMTGKANMEEIRTGNAHVSLVTADDPATIEMIKKHGQRTIDEAAAMQADRSSVK